MTFAVRDVSGWRGWRSRRSEVLEERRCQAGFHGLDGRLRHLERTIEDRATETTTSRELIVYDEGQRLVARVEVSLSTQMHQPDFSIERLQIDRLTWKEGKVAAVDRVVSDTDWSEEGSTRLTLWKQGFTAATVVAAAPAP